MDTDFREVMNVVVFTSYRDSVFATVDIKQIEQSNVKLFVFSGDEKEVYDRLKEKYPNVNFISTGYCTNQGYLLFGMFSRTYNYDTGKTYYNYKGFKGLCYIKGGGEVAIIPPEMCDSYAPAVLKLYHLDVFDTNIF